MSCFKKPSGGTRPLVMTNGPDSLRYLNEHLKLCWLYPTHRKSERVVDEKNYINASDDFADARYLS